MSLGVGRSFVAFGTRWQCPGTRETKKSKRSQPGHRGRNWMRSARSIPLNRGRKGCNRCRYDPSNGTLKQMVLCRLGIGQFNASVAVSLGSFRHNLSSRFKNGFHRRYMEQTEFYPIYEMQERWKINCCGKYFVSFISLTTLFRLRRILAYVFLE